MSSSDHASNPTTSYNTPNQTPYYQQAPIQQQHNLNSSTPTAQHFQRQKSYEASQIATLNNVEDGGKIAYPNHPEQSAFIQSPYMTQDQVIFFC